MTMDELDELEAHCKEKEAAYKEMHIKYNVPDYFTREIVYGNVLEKIAEIKARRGDGDGNVKKTVA